MQVYESRKEYKAVTIRLAACSGHLEASLRVSMLLSMPLADGFLSSEPGILERDSMERPSALFPLIAFVL